MGYFPHEMPLTLMGDELRYSSPMATLSKPQRSTREETHARIMAKADELFRRYGYGKTTVADIADELGMSTANIYKFFPSKSAIVESSADRNVAHVKETVSKIVRSRKSALYRLEEMVVAIFQFHQELFRHERQIFKLIVVAMEEEWACIDQYNDFLLQTVCDLVKEGMGSGEFRAANPDDTAQTLLDCLSLALHPHLRHKWNHDETDERVRQQVRFLGKALK